jgi:hypothetical protein
MHRLCLILPALLISGSVAHAQLPQPRCDGNPPTGGGLRLTSVLIGYAGKPCYGQVFNDMYGGRSRKRGSTFGALVAMESVRVARGPAHGSFQMIGPREFRYTPRADLHGWDKIILEYAVDGRRGHFIGHLIFRATTQEWYAAHNGAR